MKSFKIRVAIFAFVVATCSGLLFPSCRKEEFAAPLMQKNEPTDMAMPDPVDFSDPAQLQSVIGKNYDPLRSNLYGIPEDLLKSISSDELFGVENNPASANGKEDGTDANAVFPQSENESLPTVARSVDALGAGTYTGLERDPSHKLVYNFDMVLNVNQYPNNPAYHLFWALQVNFGDANGVEHNSQGAHIGLQWWDGKKANWGGYWAGGIPSGGATTISYNWQANRLYRLRVWRLGSAGNLIQWGGWVMDLTTGVERFIGTFPTWSANKWITSHVVWTEAPDVTCTTSVQANFGWFSYRRADGPDATVAHGVCDYTGGSGCNNPHKTNVTGGWGWFGGWTQHKFNTTRTNPPGTNLW